MQYTLPYLTPCVAFQDIIITSTPFAHHVPIISTFLSLLSRQSFYLSSFYLSSFCLSCPQHLLCRHSFFFPGFIQICFLYLFLLTCTKISKTERWLLQPSVQMFKIRKLTFTFQPSPAGYFYLVP